jgi:hypothetical protein
MEVGPAKRRKKIDEPHIDGSTHLLPQTVVHVPQSGVVLSSAQFSRQEGAKSLEIHDRGMTASFSYKMSVLFLKETP